jgi:hypothetical protein
VVTRGLEEHITSIFSVEVFNVDPVQSYFPKIHFNIILPAVLGFGQLYSFSIVNFVCISCASKILKVEQLQIGSYDRLNYKKNFFPEIHKYL